jgi:mono/diheme cytochrome c family protein
MSFRPLVLSALLALALSVPLAAGGCRTLGESVRGYAAGTADLVEAPPPGTEAWTAAQWGGFYALYGDFGNLNTDNLRSVALPWKLVPVLADLVPEAFFAQGQHEWVARFEEPLRRFGVVYGTRIAQPAGMKALNDFSAVPVGFSRAVVERSAPDVMLEMASVNCSLCHAGRSWDAQGNPTRELIWGLPNHSADLDGLRAAVAQALGDARATDALLLGALQRRYPNLSPAERQTYEKLVLPLLREQLAQSKARGGRPLPWSFGGPGMHNGSALLHAQLGTAGPFAPAYVKTPALFGALLKRKGLADGSLQAVDPNTTADVAFAQRMVGYLPQLGTPPARAPAEQERLLQLAAFLDELKPPRFPGPVDAEAAERGKATYGRRCAGCHGDRGPDGRYQYSDRIFSAAATGSDPVRAAATTEADAAALAATPAGRLAQLTPTGGYQPQPLLGVWAAAPYLHNGSVPTLWHLLTPEERPTRFYVGGHKLDLERVGIAGRPGPDGLWDVPEGYVSWSEPRLVDTREPGRSNRGHEKQVEGLGEPERRDLIEYLKTL